MIYDQFLRVKKNADEIKITEAKPPLLNQQRVVYNVLCITRVRDKWRENLVSWYKFTFAICRKSDSQSREVMCVSYVPLQLTPVVQTLDSAIHRINQYPVDNY